MNVRRTQALRVKIAIFERKVRSGRGCQMRDYQSSPSKYRYFVVKDPSAQCQLSVLALREGSPCPFPDPMPLRRAVLPLEARGSWHTRLSGGPDICPDMPRAIVALARHPWLAPQVTGDRSRATYASSAHSWPSARPPSPQCLFSLVFHRRFVMHRHILSIVDLTGQECHKAHRSRASVGRDLRALAEADTFFSKGADSQKGGAVGHKLVCSRLCRRLAVATWAALTQS